MVEPDIGIRIRSLRSVQGFTLQEVADKAGLTKGYLSRLEKSRKAPPVATLANLAKIFGVTISFLLGEDPEADTISIVRKDERIKTTRLRTQHNYVIESLAKNRIGQKLDPLMVTFPKNQSKKLRFSHKGEEMLYFLQGKCLFIYGERELSLGEGDCICFDSSVPHVARPQGEAQLKAIMVIIRAER